MESLALILVAFILFRPGLFLDYVEAPFANSEPQQVFALAQASAS